MWRMAAIILHICVEQKNTVGHDCPKISNLIIGKIGIVERFESAALANGYCLSLIL